MNRLSLAAKALRMAATQATEGPWVLHDSGWSWVGEDSIFSPASGESVIMPQDEQGGGSWSTDVDAFYITLVSPEIGLMWADILDLWGNLDLGEDTPFGAMLHPLAEQILRKVDSHG